MHLTRTLLALAFSAIAMPALAASSDWASAEGGRVRLVTAGKPDADGLLRGALDIQLAPGWKTYWRDPGDAGVPPSLDLSRSTGVESATIDFPAPERHDEGDFTWAGYSQPVRLPVTFRTRPGEMVSIDAGLFLGICQTICVPVSAELHLDPGDHADGDDAVVEEAFAALPRAEGGEFGAMKAAVAGGVLTVTVAVPAGAEAKDLFVSGEGEFTLGTPVLKDGAFTLPIEGPEDTAGKVLPYTLVTSAGAVSGVLKPFE